MWAVRLGLVAIRALAELGAAARVLGLAVGDSDGLGGGKIGRVQRPMTEERWPWMIRTSLWRIVTVAAVKRAV
jgi:hypothetical protein